MKPAQLALALAACAAASCTAPAAPRPRADAGPGPSTPAAVISRAPALANVRRLSDRVLSGGVPTGDVAFDELVRLGVRTIVSVDGATPDVARAEAHGLRYVHIPVTYAEVTDAQRLELARAIRDLPGPVYIHCHHGRHRGPAAAAAAGVSLGIVTPEQGVAFMRAAGTAPSYEGLYACVTCAHVATPIELDAAPAEFPAVRRAQGLVAGMVEADEAFGHLSAIRSAGWSAPPDHPDLVPAAEAGRLADDLRLSGEDAAARAHGDDFLRRLDVAVARATALEEAIVGQASTATLDARFTLVRTSCADCHETYRDRR